MPAPQVLFSKQNINTSYQDTDEDKLKVLEILDNKYQEAMKLDSTPISTKNLIYFAAYGKNYITLLEQLLCSIATYSKIDFDILIITDINGSKLIKAKDLIKKFNYYFYIVDTPEDGVAASMTKTLIYNYNRIDEYNKILFLDADMVCTKNIQEVFDIEPAGKLQAVEAFVLRSSISDRLGHPFFQNNYDNIKSLYSTLTFFNSKQNEYIRKNNPGSFSAGHFLFQNTKQMRGHFENVNWLINNWPSTYFFEQSFLNHYFVFNNLVTINEFNSKVQYVTFLTGTLVIETSEKRHEDMHVLLHFAGQPINGTGKLEYIKSYCEKHNILINT